MVDLNFWDKTSGTWINIFTVILGTSLGLLLKDRLSPKIQTIITQGIGLLTFWLGLSMANSMGQVQAGGAADAAGRGTAIAAMERSHATSRRTWHFL